MNARQVMTWIKSNVFIVAFAVVMIAALIALPIVSGKMNADVQARMKKQIQTKKDLERLGKQSVSLTVADGEERTWNTAVNQSLIDGIREYVDAETEDAEAIVDAAVAFNSAGHGAVMPGRFPPTGRMSETLPEDYHEAIVAAYDALIERVGCGGPPRGQSMASALRQQRRRFITGRLQKSETDPLTPEEQAGLASNLAEFRLGLYSDAADAVSFYVERSVLPIPEYFYTNDQHLLFGWQWDLWIVTDLLEAIVTANGGPADESRSARVDPVKRIVSMEIAPLPGWDPSAQPPTAKPSAAAQVKTSFGASHTGRVSNDLYDVRRVRLRLVVETRRIPALFDALAEENFITVLDADVTPANSWAAVTEGYYYGNEPVSDVTLELETIWLREWTRTFMPDATRSALGVWAPTETTEGGG